MGFFDEFMLSSAEGDACLPKLDESGSNWITWKDIIYGELISRGLLDHIEGFAEPVYRPILHKDRYYLASDSKLETPLDSAAADKLIADWKDWVTKQWSAKTIIFRTIPHTVMIEIRDQPTVASVWNALCRLYENRIASGRQFLIATMFRTTFDPDTTGLRAHFAYMMTLRQRYIEFNKHLPDDIFIEALIVSLPEQKFGPTMENLRIRCETTNTELTAHMVMEKAYDLWERHGIRGSDTTKNKFSANHPETTALASSKPSDDAKSGSRGGGGRHRPKCANCRRRSRVKEKKK